MLSLDIYYYTSKRLFVKIIFNYCGSDMASTRKADVTLQAAAPGCVINGQAH